MSIQKILLAEDDDDISELITELLVEEGFSCVQVYDGVTATQLLKKDSFDLLITDFKMPLMDGLQLLEWCRSEGMGFPVIFISANSNLIQEDVVPLKNFTASIIKKPMDIDQILFAVRNA